MFPQRHASVILEPFGSGFVVRYPVADSATLALVRQYQQEVRSDYPGWLSRLEFNRSQDRLNLYVFPMSELPAAVLGRRQSYGAAT